MKYGIVRTDGSFTTHSLQVLRERSQATFCQVRGRYVQATRLAWVSWTTGAGKFRKMRLRVGKGARKGMRMDVRLGGGRVLRVRHLTAEELRRLRERNQG